jgi:hypothetical protein
VSIGSSSASHDLIIDDKGKLISTATSELDNVSIGPKNEVHFSRLVTTAQALGSGAENTKDGRADLRITDFFILDNPVELTRAGLRLANAGPSEQEAYDGAKVLLQKLRDRGISLELPNFDAQLSKTADHVTADTQGLRVRFEQSVSGTAVGLSHPLELGHATAVVAALDADRHIEVKPGPNGGMVVETTPSTVPVAGQPRPGQATPGTQGNLPKPTSGSTTKPPASTGPGRTQPPSSSGAVNPPAPATGAGPSVTAPVVDPGSPVVGEGTPLPGNPDEVAFNLRDVQNKLGLRGARSVSRAFGAFLGLGLILPLARFVIRRLG